MNLVAPDHVARTLRERAQRIVEADERTGAAVEQVHRALLEAWVEGHAAAYQRIAEDLRGEAARLDRRGR